jgi:antitoxin HicB
LVKYKHAAGLGRSKGVTEEYRYSVILEPQEEGGFTVLVPALPEVVTEGETEEEALQMAEEAIRAILAYRRAKGSPIPADAAPSIRQVRVVAEA